MNEEQRLSEPDRREVAQKLAGDVVEESGRKVPVTEMKQMISVRLEPELISRLRKLATKRGASQSDLLREAVTLLIDQDRPQEKVLPTTSGELMGTSQLIPVRMDFHYWDGEQLHASIIPVALSGSAAEK